MRVRPLQFALSCLCTALRARSYSSNKRARRKKERHIWQSTRRAISSNSSCRFTARHHWRLGLGHLTAWVRTFDRRSLTSLLSFWSTLAHYPPRTHTYTHNTSVLDSAGISTFALLEVRLPPHSLPPPPNFFHSYSQESLFPSHPSSYQNPLPPGVASPTQQPIQGNFDPLFHPHTRIHRIPLRD